jgi:hypothetical protein
MRLNIFLRGLKLGVVLNLYIPLHEVDLICCDGPFKVTVMFLLYSTGTLPSFFILGIITLLMSRNFMHFYGKVYFMFFM